MSNRPQKMMLMPIHGQHEQTVNAHYVQKLGLGLFPKQLNVNAMAQYLAMADQPMSSHPDIIWPDNESFFQVLAQTIDNVASGLNVRRPQNTPLRRRLALG